MDWDGILIQAVKAVDVLRATKALSQGANPGATGTRQGHDLLSLAARAGKLELVELLLEAGARVGAGSGFSTCLHAAVAGGNPDIVRLLLRAGGRRLLDRFDADDRTPLMCAVLGGHLEVARILIEAGCAVDAHANGTAGDTALRMAAADASLDMVRLLVEAGANPLLEGRLTLTPLDRARERRTPEGRLIAAYLERFIQSRPTPQRQRR